jgi:hypothetical protein
MVSHTVHQLVFVCESYVKYGSADKCCRKCCHKFPGYTIASARGIHEHIKEVRFTGSLLDNKCARKLCVFVEERLDKIGDWLERMPHKSQRRLAQETRISEFISSHIYESA